MVAGDVLGRQPHPGAALLEAGAIGNQVGNAAVAQGVIDHFPQHIIQQGEEEVLELVPDVAAKRIQQIVNALTKVSSTWENIGLGKLWICHYQEGFPDEC